ncbi:MAG: glycosyltransferase [Candidatus Woesearchaeota archaeon]
MISIILCAHNEEKMIGSMLAALKEEVNGLKESYEMIVCLSGCSDDTEKIVRHTKRRLELDIRIVKTPKGKIRSQIIALSLVSKRSWAHIFLDSDIKIQKDAILNMVKDAKAHPNVQMFYAHEVPVKRKGIFYNIINVRTLNPEYVIAKENVEAFHPYERNKRKKVFATGGIYLLRKGVYDIDIRTLGDDSYLTHLVYHRFGFGAIKETENSIFIYQPVITFNSWVNKWKRIWSDINQLYVLHPEFRYLERYMQLKIDFHKLVKEGRIRLFLYFFLERFWNFFGKKIYIIFFMKRNINDWEPLTDTKRVIA